jgi:tRNA(adenine34) deaminase
VDASAVGASGDPDDRLMRVALDEARAAGAEGDVPVGAAVARGDEVVGRAGNARERERDPTAHAEILALRQAARALGSWHLEGCTLYATLEPCAMCAGALVLARIDRLVLGAPDPKAGFAGSLGDIVRDGRLNHEVEVTVGVLAEECGEVLRAFFAERR